MSQLSVDVADTFIDSDRRTSARVPLFAPVKIGPPGSVPTAEVSAADISSGGLFVDADRPVRVGARFSVQVELPTKEAIYIPEVEVVYNRERRQGAGFGCTFVEFGPEAQRLLEDAVREAQLKSFVSPPMNWREVSSDVPTTLPSPHEHVPPERQGVRLDSSIDKRLAQLDPGPLELTEVPSPEAFAVDMSGRPEAAEYTSWFGGSRKVMLTAAAGALLTVAGFVGLALGGDATAEAVGPSARSEGTVSASTHRVLMGDADADELDTVAPRQLRATGEKKRDLPPLVPLEAFSPSAKPAVVAPKPAPIAPKPAPIASKPAPIASKPAPRADKVAVVKEVKGGLRLSIPVQPGVTVKKTAVYTNPDRYVIDVVGQIDVPRLPLAKGKVQRVRYGRHADFSRFVVDVDGALELGRAKRVGDTLEITLVLR